MVVVRNYFPEFPSLCISKLLAAISVCETNHLARTERRRPLYEGDIPPLRSSVLFVPLSVRRQHASVLLLVFSSPASLHHHPTSLLQKWQNDTESSPFLSVFVTSNLPEMSSPLILLVALQHCQPSLMDGYVYIPLTEVPMVLSHITSPRQTDPLPSLSCSVDHSWPSSSNIHGVSGVQSTLPPLSGAVQTSLVYS